MKDPRQPRPNPEIREVVRAMERTLRDLRCAAGHGERRGYAAILQAHAEYLLELPELLRDLEEGPARTGRELLLPELPHTLSRIVDPFEHAGAFDPGSVVLWPSGRGITPVLSVEESSLYDPFTLSAYWVVTLEPLYATAHPTTAHFRDQDALRRHLPVTSGAVVEGAHILLCDPLGCGAGEVVVVVEVRPGLAAAVKRADQHAERFGVRFLVARMLGRVHTH